MIYWMLSWTVRNRKKANRENNHTTMQNVHCIRYLFCWLFWFEYSYTYSIGITLVRFKIDWNSYLLTREGVLMPSMESESGRPMTPRFFSCFINETLTTAINHWLMVCACSGFCVSTSAYQSPVVKTCLVQCLVCSVRNEAPIVMGHLSFKCTIYHTYMWSTFYKQCFVHKTHSIQWLCLNWKFCYFYTVSPTISYVTGIWPFLYL